MRTGTGRARIRWERVAAVVLLAIAFGGLLWLQHKDVEEMRQWAEKFGDSEEYRQALRQRMREVRLQEERAARCRALCNEGGSHE